MKMTTLSLTLLPVIALPALAMGQGATDLDANGDGMLSVEEVQVAFPDVTAETFMAMDTNTDGLLDADEVALAQESGLMPATDG